MSTNYTSTRPIDDLPQRDENFLPKYATEYRPQRFSRVFDNIGQTMPRNML